MKVRVISALCASLLIIGGASWHRFTEARQVDGDLVAIRASNARNNVEIVSEDIFDIGRLPSASSTPLTETDLIGRQLFADYLSLVQAGQATEANLETLAGKYIDKIPDLNKVSNIGLSDLNRVANTKKGLESYEHEVNKIHEEYAERMSKVGASIKNLSPQSPAFYNFARALGSAYGEAASKLRNTPVPMILAGSHLRLVNNYLSSAEAMKSVSDPNGDPAVILAGLVSIKANVEEQTVLVSEISDILKKNGI